MEFINAIQGSLTENWGVIAAIILPFILPNSWLDKIFYGVGKTLSVILRQKVGKNGEAKLEGWITGTLGTITTALSRGMQEDDNA